MFIDKKFVKMRDGAELYVQIKQTTSPIWIVATHGIGEQLERHQYIPELFGKDFNIFQYDLRGHGRSTGRRAWVQNFSQYMEDLKEIICFLEETYRMERYILFGHSMGALISCAFMQNYVEESRYPERMVVNAPPCGAPGLFGKILKGISPAILGGACEIPYSVPIGGLVNLDYLSHDPHVKEEYLKNELNALTFQSKLIFELMKTAQATFAEPIRSKCPNFATVSGSDKVVGAADSIEYFTIIDKTFNLKIFDGAYHEIHNEIEMYRKPYFEHLKSIFGDVLGRPQE